MERSLDDVAVETMTPMEDPSAGGPGPRSELSKSAENLTQDQRLKKKATRVTRHLSKDGIPLPNGATGSLVQQSTRRWKNSRRSRKSYGRGLPKKGGAGGKGVWGKLGSELMEEEVNFDKNDPNYDSDSLDNGDIELATVIPESSDEELRRNIESLILEYFEHGDASEVVIGLEELNFSDRKYLIPQIALEIALDHKPSHREMTSVLISDLYGHVLKQRDIAQAFDMLMKNLPDLILDTPDADAVLGNFLARAIADDCIPPKVIQVLKEKAECQHTMQALSRADTLLSMKHGLVRLDNVWGVGGGIRPVKYLVRQMSLLLQEYLSSGDVKEATRCLLELEVPHFHHELVYEVIVMTLEAISTLVEEKMCALLKSMCDAIIITPEMLETGFFRVYADMPDIILDVPLAATVLERFVEQCNKAGFLTEEIVKRMPTRGRKRFVSEGDGGRVKDHL